MALAAAEAADRPLLKIKLAGEGDRGAAQGGARRRAGRGIDRGRQ